MANETILRKGFIANANSSVTGTLTATSTLTASGLTYPTTDGTVNQAIVTNASGILSFASVTLAGANISTLTNDSGFISDLTSESIGTLSDVDTSGLVTSDILQYNGTNWVPVDIDTIMGAQNLDDLGDVTITSAASGDFLRYSGSAWVDSTIQDGDIAQSAVTQHEAALSITESQISDLGTYQATSEKGQANGYASLDGSGLVPAAQLPSYVDDVEEYATDGDFPGTGETGKLYVDIADGDVFRWTGSAYLNLTDYASPVHTHVVSDITDFATEAADAADTQIAAASIADLSNVGAVGTNGQVYVSNGTSLVATTLNHDNISDFDTEVTTLIGATAPASHTHTASEITDFDTEVDNQIAAASIEDLSDVAAMTEAAGDVLSWNGSTWTNANDIVYARASKAVATDAADTIVTLDATSVGAAQITYTISDGTNMRIGTLLCISDGSNMEVSDIITNMIGAEATIPEFSGNISGTDFQIQISDASGYTVKTATFDMA